ncbi:unnamed protein product [Symbiodinium natans]|uniref:Uncharacterized protein n=1 Tax=Symbiodinium natans TaxID=878477 RepID=A0A812V7U1_9DINO|nr:unnamed protein product [Symbiodinium natans]
MPPTTSKDIVSLSLLCWLDEAFPICASFTLLTSAAKVTDVKQGTPTTVRCACFARGWKTPHASLGWTAPVRTASSSILKVTERRARCILRTSGPPLTLSLKPEPQSLEGAHV